MKNTISSKDLKMILNKGKKKSPSGEQKKKARTYYDRLREAVESGFSHKKDISYIDEKSIVLEFNNVSILSHNDILRINFKQLYPYIKMWKERVKENIKKISEKEKEKFNSEKVKIEFLFKLKHKKFLDYDATVACSKFIIDGIVESGFLDDDTIEIVPVILTDQVKNSEDESSILVVINEITESELLKYFSNTLIKNKKKLDSK